MPKSTILLDDNGNVVEMTDKKHAVTISITTQELLQMLLKVEIGDRITFDEMSKKVEMDVTAKGDAYGYLHSARYIAENRFKRHFASVRGVGYERIDGETVAQNAPNMVRKVVKRARREKRRIKNIPNFDKLSQDSKNKAYLADTILSFQMTAAQKKVVAKIEQKVKASNNTLPTAQMLEALK